MMRKNFHSDGDPSAFGHRPSKEEQEKLLDDMNHEHMKIIVSDPELYHAITESFVKFHGKYSGEDKPRNFLRGELKLTPSSCPYGSRKDDGSWEEGETISVGFRTYLGDTYFAHIGKRVFTNEGFVVVPDEGFTLEQAETVSAMIDELQQAKRSGQLPDLSHAGYDRIFIQPAD